MFIYACWCGLSNRPAPSWRLVTSGFAVLQTAGSFALAALFAASGAHGLVIVAGAVLSALALMFMPVPRGGPDR